MPREILGAMGPKDSGLIVAGVKGGRIVTAKSLDASLLTLGRKWASTGIEGLEEGSESGQEGWEAPGA